MTTLLFVHGTGVRGPDFDKSFAIVKEQARQALGAIDVQACLWGDALGASLLQGGASVPSYDAARRAAEPEEQTRRQENVRWSLLYDDPLYELRSLTALAGDDGFGDGGAPQSRPSVVTLPQLRQIAFGPATAARLARARHDVAALREAAVARLVGDGTFEHAIDSPPLADDATRKPAVARAFVAAWTGAAIDRELPALSGELRDLMVQDTVASLGGATAGLKDLFAGCLVGLAQVTVNPLVRAYRRQATDAATPKIGDILKYQVHGAAVRNYIAARIQACDGPVWVLAHSLGGIASFELLATRALPQVRGLVTVGSQAPFLYELDALATLRFGAPLPTDFPDWLNVHDLDDLLSYVGEELFPGRVRDIAVASGQPFPISHGAYWENDAFWIAMKSFVA